MQAAIVPRYSKRASHIAADEEGRQRHAEARLRKERCTLLSPQIAPEHVVEVGSAGVAVVAPVIHSTRDELELSYVMLHVEQHRFLVRDLQVYHEVPVPRRQGLPPT
jgi:hypothetical protein